MIKVDKENLEISGFAVEIQSELSTIINTLYEKKYLSKDDILHSVEVGFMSKEEVKEKIKILESELTEDKLLKAEELLKKLMGRRR